MHEVAPFSQRVLVEVEGKTFHATATQTKQPIPLRFLNPETTRVFAEIDSRNPTTRTVYEIPLTANQQTTFVSRNRSTDYIVGYQETGYMVEKGILQVGEKLHLRSNTGGYRSSSGPITSVVIVNIKTQATGVDRNYLPTNDIPVLATHPV